MKTKEELAEETAERLLIAVGMGKIRVEDYKKELFLAGFEAGVEARDEGNSLAMLKRQVRSHQRTLAMAEGKAPELVQEHVLKMAREVIEEANKFISERSFPFRELPEIDTSVNENSKCAK